MFNSAFKEVGEVCLPAFSGTRVMMMPLVIGDLGSVPDRLRHWGAALRSLFDMSAQHQGKVGVLCLAPEAGLGVRDAEKRAKHETAINIFRNR